MIWVNGDGFGLVGGGGRRNRWKTKVVDRALHMVGTLPRFIIPRSVWMINLSETRGKKNWSLQEVVFGVAQIYNVIGFKLTSTCHFRHFEGLNCEGGRRKCLYDDWQAIGISWGSENLQQLKRNEINEDHLTVPRLINPFFRSFSLHLFGARTAVGQMQEEQTEVVNEINY